MKIALVCLFGMLSIAAYCQPLGGCALGVTRCAENIAEICNANGVFEVLADCDEVSAQSEAPFVCTFIDVPSPEGPVRGHTCVLGGGGAGGVGER